MPSRYDRRRDQRPSEPRPPSPEEWAMASLTVARHTTADPSATRYELTKEIERGGRKFKASVWLSVGQMRAMARDHGE